MVIEQNATQFPEDQAPKHTLATERVCNTGTRRPVQNASLKALRDVRRQRITPLDDLFFWNSSTLASSILGDDYGSAITKPR